MKTNLILDTNVVIYALEGKRHVIDLIQDESLHISFVTEIELLSWKNLSKGDEKLIVQFIKDCQILEYDTKVKPVVIQFLRKYNLKLPDAIIAASAHQFGYPLISADSIFGKIKEIDFFLIKP